MSASDPSFSLDYLGYRNIADVMVTYNRTLIEFSPSPEQYLGVALVSVKESLASIAESCRQNRRLQKEAASLWSLMALTICSRRLKEHGYSEAKFIDLLHPTKESGSLKDPKNSADHRTMPLERQLELNYIAKQIFQLADLPLAFKTKAMQQAELTKQLEELSWFNRVLQKTSSLKEDPILLLLVTLGSCYSLLAVLAPLRVPFSQAMANFAKIKIIKKIIKLLKPFVSSLQQGVHRTAERESLATMSILIGLGIYAQRCHEAAEERERWRFFISLLEGFGMIFPRLARNGYIIDSNGIVRINSMQFYPAVGLSVFYVIWNYLSNEQKQQWMNVEREWMPKIFSLFDFGSATVRHGAFMGEIIFPNMINNLELPIGMVLAILERKFPQYKNLIHSITWVAMGTKLIHTLLDAVKKDFEADRISSIAMIMYAGILLGLGYGYLSARKRFFKHLLSSSINSIYEQGQNLSQNIQYGYRRLTGAVPAIAKATNAANPAKLLTESDNKFAAEIANTVSRDTAAISAVATPLGGKPAKTLRFRYKSNNAAPAASSNSEKTSAATQSAASPSIAGSLLFDYKGANSAATINKAGINTDKNPNSNTHSANPVRDNQNRTNRRSCSSIMSSCVIS